MNVRSGAVDNTNADSADVIVVGGGGAALAAAAEAAKLECRVIVVEKNPVLGGSTGLSVGLLIAAGTHLQRRAGIEDSAEVHAAEYARFIEAQGIADNPELRRLLVDSSAETVRFLASIGVDFFGPLENPPFKTRRFQQVLPGGRACIYRLERHCRSLGVEIRCRTRARRLLLAGGRVCGVEVESPEGMVETLFARSGIILATGDISANPELRTKFVGSGSEAIEAYNPTATGDGHLMALAIGARIVSRLDLGASVGTVAFPPAGEKNVILSLPPRRCITLAMKLALAYLPARMVRPFILKAALPHLSIEPAFYAAGAILINRNGERFADELRVTGADIASQPRGEAFILFDNRIATLFGAWPHYVSAVPGLAYAYVDDYRNARRDLFFRARSVESLASRLGIPAGRLQETVASLGLRRGEAKFAGAAPYFALGPLVARVRHVPVGIGVNARLQVLTETGEPIPGLFAAGDAGQGGFVAVGHGHSLSWAFTTGRLAGRNAALELAHARPASL